MTSTVASSEMLTTIEKYLSEVKFANAVTLARCGQYTAAEQILAELIHTEGEQALYLDLQARILAQQGLLRDAEYKWSRATTISSESGVYQKVLYRIANLQKSSVRLSPLFLIIPGLLIAILFLAGILLKPSFATAGANDQASLTPPVNFANLENQIARLGEELMKLQVDNPSVIPPNLNLEQIGFNAKKSTNEITIVFNEGIFEKGAIISAAAQRILINLGKQLEPYAGVVYIQIFGITDDLPISQGQRFQDNWDLGNARALAVHSLLRKETQLLPERILIGSYGQLRPPFPNSSQENRKRNRTVIFKVSYSI